VTARRRPALLAALALGLTSTRLAADGEPWTAPAEARARVSPVAATPEALERGRELYLKHCASCHGPKGHGDGPSARFGPEPASDLTAPRAPRTDGEVFWKISSGRKAGIEVVMPSATKDIPREEDRWKVVAYVRTLVQADAPPSHP
jgi:mono/diheme cytochrome c family protein